MRPVIALFAALSLCGLLPADPARAAAPKAMVAAANPAAVEAGLNVLRRGGSAVDAAIAVQAMLGLVEPQSSGVGGGAFMVYYDARSHKLTAYDGRETAPAGASPDMFLTAEGRPLSRAAAMLSGRSAGVPGAIAMLALAHREHGRKPWNSLFTDSERLADAGFVVGPRLIGLISSRAPQTAAPDVIAYFRRPDGTPLRVGDRLRNTAYAATMRRLAALGPAAILEGPVARDIVQRLAQLPLPGAMTLADLAGYAPHAAPALCRPYRVWIVCAPNPPSGGTALLQALGLLERTDIASRGPADPIAWLRLAQAERLMYADRDRYVGDPAFVRVPVAGMLDPGYLDARARLFSDMATPPPSAGLPPGAPKTGADTTAEPGGTSHFVVVDKAGNVVSMTTTIESLFGDGRMVDGFFLNNQLTDFSFTPTDSSGARVANAVAPGKRPRSSMAPAIILDRRGAFVAAIGSPGGPAIPAFVLKTIVGVLDWKLSMQDAIALPNMVAIGNFYLSEPAKLAPGVVEGLKARGVTLYGGSAGEGSGLHGVMVRDGRTEGGADPRREGVARPCCQP